MRGQRRAAAGFTLLETLISLVLMLVALGLASDLLMQSSKLLAETAREVRDAPISLVLARLRGDVMASGDFLTPFGSNWSTGSLDLTGHWQSPEGTIQFQRVGTELRRRVLDADGYLEQEVVLGRGVTGWAWRPVMGWNTKMVEIDVLYHRSAAPRSPLPTLPRYHGPRYETVTETLLIAPRADGLGHRW